MQTSGEVADVNVVSVMVEEGHGRESIRVRVRRRLRRWFEERFGDASSWSCFFNLANTIVGAGMLGLPYAFAASGWVLGTILLVIFGLATIFALHILSVCALKIGTPASFYTVARRTMPSMTLVIDVAVAVMTFGVGISYLMVVSDLMPDVMEQIGAPHSVRNRTIWVFLGFAIAAPLACMKRMDALKFTSMLCLMFVVFIIIMIILFSADAPGMDPCASVDDGDTCVGENTNIRVDVNTFRTMPMIVFAYTCHQNIFGVTNELRNLTQPRVDKVIYQSVAVAFAVYIVAACCGYATYGDEVESNILVSFPRTAITSTARIFVSLNVAFSYPLQAHPCRACVLSLWHAWDKHRFSGPIARMIKRMAARGSVSGASPGGSATIMSPVQHGAALSDATHTHTHAHKDNMDGISSVRSSDVTVDEPTITAAAAEAQVPVVLSPDGGFVLSERAQQLRYWVVTAAYLGLTLVLALTITDFSLILGIVGATGSTMVSFILPGFFYYILFKNEGPAWKRYLALFMGCIGLVIMPVCLVLLFI